MNNSVQNCDNTNNLSTTTTTGTLTNEDNSTYTEQLTTNTNTNTVATADSLTVGNTYVARVKWFNNTIGYGFVTILDNNVDLFVHHSQIKPHTQCWRTLVTGEYVELVVGEDNRGKKCGHSVTGIQGGQLLCESMTPYMRNRFQGPNSHNNNNNNNNDNGLHNSDEVNYTNHSNSPVYTAQ